MTSWKRAINNLKEPVSETMLRGLFLTQIEKASLMSNQNKLVHLTMAHSAETRSFATRMELAGAWLKNSCEMITTARNPKERRLYYPTKFSELELIVRNNFCAVGGQIRFYESAKGRAELEQL